MEKKVTFCAYELIHYTYSRDDYDRGNDDLPTLILKSNAMNFGGEYMNALRDIYDELYEYKNTEMKNAFETAQLYKRRVMNVEMI